MIEKCEYSVYFVCESRKLVSYNWIIMKIGVTKHEITVWSIHTTEIDIYVFFFLESWSLKCEKVGRVCQ